MVITEYLMWTVVDVQGSDPSSILGKSGRFSVPQFTELEKGTRDGTSRLDCHEDEMSQSMADT